MLARITTRSGYCIIQSHTEAFGWGGYVTLDGKVKEELKFFIDHMDEGNGAKIKNSLTEARLDTIVPNPISKVETIHHAREDAQVFVSDASDTKAFVYELTGASKKVLEYSFNKEQREASSSARELLAILMTLRQAAADQSLKNTFIYWCTDSENAARAMSKGSRTPAIQAIVFEIALLSKKLQIKIEPIYLRREDPRIQVADLGSKALDTDNWSIDQSSFQSLDEIFHFDYDMFADSFNKKCEKFCSLYYHEDARAVDAFSISWEKKGNLWLSPPVKDLLRCHRRITNCECKGVLIMPMWHTSSYLSFFMENGEKTKEPFTLIKKWKPYIIQNEGATNTALFGFTPFWFVALGFNTIPANAEGGGNCKQKVNNFM